MILSLKPNRSQGPDGFTPEFYKKFIERLSKHLVKVFNYCLREKQIPKTWQEALIILITKHDKDLQEPSIYRPKSLLNLDYKKFAQVWT